MNKSENFNDTIKPKTNKGEILSAEAGNFDQIMAKQARATRKLEMELGALQETNGRPRSEMIKDFDVSSLDLSTEQGKGELAIAIIDNQKLTTDAEVLDCIDGIGKYGGMDEKAIQTKFFELLQEKSRIDRAQKLIHELIHSTNFEEHTLNEIFSTKEKALRKIEEDSNVSESERKNASSDRASLSVMRDVVNLVANMRQNQK